MIGSTLPEGGQLFFPDPGGATAAAAAQSEPRLQALTSCVSLTKDELGGVLWL